MTAATREETRARDYCKRKAIKYNSEYYWVNYKNLRNGINIVMRKAKSEYYTNKIRDGTHPEDASKSWSLAH